MKALLIFLISFNLWATPPVYKVTDSVQVTVSCDKMGMNGTIIKVWTGDSPMYLVEFSDGVQIQLDEDQITLNP